MFKNLIIIQLPNETKMLQLNNNINDDKSKKYQNLHNLHYLNASKRNL